VLDIIGWLPRAKQVASNSSTARRRRPSRLRGQRGSAERSRRRGLGGCEQLESKLLLTVGVVDPIPAQIVPATIDASSEVLLASRFALQDVAGTVVRVNTNAPLQNSSFFVELFDNAAAAPVRVTTATAQNFLRYVDDGSFDRSIVHRSIPGFVVQGGGFTAPTVPANQPNSSPLAINSKGTVRDEIGNPNQRGTIAMAKVAPVGGPTVADSATSQWFVNLDDNTGLDAEFTAFGRVLGNGMTVIDLLAAAPPWNMSEYYSNGALTDTPLWDVASDGVLRPENFVTFTGMSRAGSGQLVSLAVTSANSNLLRTQLVGDRLILSRAGTLAGTTTVTVRASAIFDPTDFVNHTFEVTVPPLPAVMTVIEDAGAVTLFYDAAGRLFAGSTSITLSGASVDYHAFKAAGWDAVAAERIGGVNTLVWRHASGNLHFWRLSESWVHYGSDGWEAPGSGAFNATEIAFGMDFNDDSVIGAALTTIEAVGGVTLAYDGGGSLFAGGLQITLSGNPVNYHVMNELGWRAVAADVIDGVNTLVWRHASGNLHFWRFSSTWAQQGSEGWEAPGSGAFYGTEVAFDMDFDDDGVIGAALTTIESVGGVALAYDGAGSLFAGGVQITLSGNPVNYHVMNELGWRAVAAERIDDVNTLVWRHASGNLHFWRFSNTWAQQVGEGWEAPGSGEFNATEVAFDIDFNDDGVIGAALTTIESAGSVTLSYDRVGSLFAGATRITLGGNPVDYNAMNTAGWRAVAAEAVNGVNTLVWRHASGNLHFWRLSGSWAQQVGEGWQAPGSSEFYASERAFGTDFNDDSVIGGPLTVIENVGTVRLGYDDAGHLFANAAKVTLGGNPVDFHAMNDLGWRAVAAEAVDGVNAVVWRHTSRVLHFWRLSDSWAHLSSDGSLSPRTPETQAVEQSFGMDLNGNGHIGR